MGMEYEYCLEAEEEVFPGRTASSRPTSICQGAESVLPEKTVGHFAFTKPENKAPAPHLAIAKEALVMQSEAVMEAAQRLGPEFHMAVEMILECEGRVVVCGIGKSGLVGRKIAATLASTGTHSFFLHPGEAFHGDMGMLKPIDVVILVSYSGETDEVVRLMPSLKLFGNRIIAMTGNSGSSLARHADIWLDISVMAEVCPNNLAPTTSTLVTMAMGDALAVALIRARNFQPADFARFHPGGSLGRKLLTRVGDVMQTVLPIVTPDTHFQDCLFTMTNGRMGMALVMEGKKLRGVVTDGDLRRAMQKEGGEMKSLLVCKFMNTSPLTIDVDARISDAEIYMREKKVKCLVVTNKKDSVCGILEYIF